MRRGGSAQGGEGTAELSPEISRWQSPLPQSSPPAPCFGDLAQAHFLLPTLPFPPPTFLSPLPPSLLIYNRAPSGLYLPHDQMLDPCSLWKLPPLHCPPQPL